MKLNVGFVTTVSGRWPRELPNARHEKCSQWLTENFQEINLVKTDSIAVNNRDVEKAVEEFRTQAVDIVIVVLGAFTGDSAAVLIAEKLQVPVILWALPEPPFDGGRIISNSLVAATMNAAALKRMDYQCHFTYGDVSDKRLKAEIGIYIKSYGAIKKLKNTFLGLLGYRPTAFYSSTFDEILIRKKFGIKMEGCDLSLLFDKAAKIDKKVIEDDVRNLKDTVSIKDLPEEYLENHSRLYFAVKEIIEENGFDALSLKCWPEMGNFHYTPCAVISRFADEGYIIGCETDIDATISMLMENYLTGKMTFMCDLINVNEKENTALFWHCGQAGLKLLEDKSKAVMSNHSLAGEGAVFEGTLRPGKVTIARMSKIGNDYKLFIVKGEAVKTDKMIKGVMVKVKLEPPVLDVIYKIAETGVPHHYSVVWDDISEDLKTLSNLLGAEIIEV